MTSVSRVAGDVAARAAREPLDNTAWVALRTRHAHLAVAEGQVLRYHPDVAPFVGLPDEPDEQDWADLAAVLRRTGPAALKVPLPAGWAERYGFAAQPMDAVQLTGAGFAAPSADEDEVVELGVADVPETLDLTARTEPGPFRPRTVEFGGYLGIRRDGVLAAMAGQRMSVPDGTGGWTEISAVCTDPAYRGHGLATRLMRVLAARIRARGDEVFLHAVASNTNAIALYEHLGFTLRRTLVITVLTPQD